MNINIYLAYEKVGKKALKSQGMYVLEAVNDDGTPFEVCGEPYVIHKLMKFDNVNKCINEMDMLIEALGRIKDKSKISVFTDNESIFYTLKNGWNLQWEKNGWKNAKGLEIKHVDKWKQITELLHEHSYEVKNERHSYSTWMSEEIRRKAG